MSPAPVAAQVQGYSNELDHQMTQQARAGNGRRRWWWGVRKWRSLSNFPNYSPPDVTPELDDLATWLNGAWCYLCDRPIATWSSRWPVTEQAKALICLHRMSHIQERLDALLTLEATR